MANAHGVEVHVRSVFLQGAAFFSPDALPKKLGALAPSIRILDQIASSLQVARPVLFWAWARHLGASRLLTGCERVDQLHEQLGWFEEATPLLKAIETITHELPALGPELLDPSRWS